jgi:hypothetical protein
LDTRNLLILRNAQYAKNAQSARRRYTAGTPNPSYLDLIVANLTCDLNLFNISKRLTPQEAITMISETEFWSFDPGHGRGIRETLKPSEHPGIAQLDLRWDDGKPVRFPVELSFVDLQNLLDVVLDYARNHGIQIKMPEEEMRPR